MMRQPATKANTTLAKIAKNAKGIKMLSESRVVGWIERSEIHRNLVDFDTLNSPHKLIKFLHTPDK